VFKSALAAAALVAVALLVYGSSLRNEYHLDSVYRVELNTELDRVVPITRFFTDPATSTAISTLSAYRPLLPLSLAINRQASKSLGLVDSAGMHLGNVLLGGALAIAAYCLCLVLQCWWAVPRARGQALIVGLIILVHPVCAVPVNYVCGRDLLLALVFMTLASPSHDRDDHRPGDHPEDPAALEATSRSVADLPGP